MVIQENAVSESVSGLIALGEQVLLVWNACSSNARNSLSGGIDGRPSLA
jgi:hypothetical protein